MRIILLLICFCLNILIGNCQSITGGKFVLNGMVYGRDTGFIILSYTNSSDKWIRDTTYLHEGKFRFEGEIKEPTRASILGHSRIVDFNEVNFGSIFIEPVIQKIELVENDYEHAIIKGSFTQNEFDSLKSNYAKIDVKYKDIQQNLLSAKYEYKAATTEKEKELALKKEGILLEQLQPGAQEYIQENTSFIRQHPDSYVSPFICYVIINDLPLDSAKNLFHTLKLRIQTSIYGKYVADLFRQKEQNTIGKEPYNFKAVDIKGKAFSLSNFKGKYVYIDFWASWCAPCRAAIPNLKKQFELYNSKGFEILTISIDNDSTAWQRAVAEENINNWTNILVNNEIINNYENVKNPIPSGMLISPEGKIVWKTGYDQKLDDILKRLIK